MNRRELVERLAALVIELNQLMAEAHELNLPVWGRGAERPQDARKVGERPQRHHPVLKVGRASADTLPAPWPKE